VTVLILEIIGGIVAFGLGIWLGMPGRYTQTADDIEEIMTSGLGRRSERRERFTPLAWVQRRASARGPSRGRRERRDRGGGGGRFNLESPKDR
jgi:hypothetical protein